ncbi:hypothetical protein BDV26DRAFT_258860 [Aspergillus bertholletiae]|uniref:Uncharacterized protein n=1 Tax=Aspergillus bertholletiae TaxID=1226010 RepID=A0A5N7BD90_9EURO|nr:hypothetical protein BDV26DRAFT_258860 [Aspergillus bertholletiae]
MHTLIESRLFTICQRHVQWNFNRTLCPNSLQPLQRECAYCVGPIGLIRVMLRNIFA